MKPNLVDRLVKRIDPFYILVFLFSLPAILPFMRPGYFLSADGLQHLYRLAGLDKAIHSGVLYPRWFPDFAFGYGYPRFGFYSPLSFYIAEIFHLLGGSYIASFKLTFMAGLILSGLAMYLYAQEIIGRYGGLIAAVAYVYAPYHLIDSHLRGALPEQLAFVFFPLILWAFYKLFNTAEPRYALLNAILYAGLFLTHNLAAFIFTPVLLLYIAFLVLVTHSLASMRELPQRRVSMHSSYAPLKQGACDDQLAQQCKGLSLAAVISRYASWSERVRQVTRRNRVILYVIFSFLLAVGLTTFCWLPVLMETRWVGLAAACKSVGYQNRLVPLREFFSSHLIYHYFPEPGGKPEPPLGLIQTLLAMASLLVLFRLRQSEDKMTYWHIIFFQAVVVLSSFMMLSVSLPIWRFLEPILVYIEFPWRFHILTTLGMAILIGSVVLLVYSRRSLVYPFAFLLIPFSLIASSLADLPFNPLFLGSEDQWHWIEAMWRDDYQHGWIGNAWTPAFVPIWVKEEAQAIPRPLTKTEPVAALQDLSPAGIPQVALGPQGLLSHELKVQTEKGMRLILHQFYFPGWRAQVNGQEGKVYPAGTLGLVALDLPAGKHLVRIWFGDTLPRKIGNAFSLLSFVTFMGAVILAKQRRAFLVGGSFMLLIIALAIWHIRPFAFSERPTSLEVNLEDKVKLLGYSLDKEVYRPGDELQVTLYWLALAQMNENYKVFVHFTDAGGTKWGQHDGDPMGGFTPTTRWLAGELVVDRHYFRIPREAPPGRYHLFTGMYEFPKVRNLTVLNPEMAVAGNRILLREVSVVESS